MCVAGYLRKCIRGLWFQLKGISVFALVPILGLYGLLPFMNYLAYRFQSVPSVGENMLYDNILRMSQYFVPLLSVWWILFVLEHYVEEPSHELLYLDYRLKLGELLLLYAGFLMLMVPLFVVYTRIFPTFWWLFLKLAVLNLFYLASAYCTAYISGKLLPAILLVLFYTLYVIAESSTGFTEHHLLPLEEMIGPKFLEGMAAYILLDLVLLMIGGIANYFYPERGGGPD